MDEGGEPGLARGGCFSCHTPRVMLDKKTVMNVGCRRYPSSGSGDRVGHSMCPHRLRFRRGMRSAAAVRSLLIDRAVSRLMFLPSSVSPDCLANALPLSLFVLSSPILPRLPPLFLSFFASFPPVLVFSCLFLPAFSRLFFEPHVPGFVLFRPAASLSFFSLCFRTDRYPVPGSPPLHDLPDAGREAGWHLEIEFFS